jgi:hypothetical protein
MLAVSTLGACAALSGLGSYSMGDCAGECDASLGGSSRGGGGSTDSGKDVGRDQASGADVDSPEEANDTNESADASEWMDSGALDAEEAVDSNLDTGVADSGGCGETTTVENCSACGLACNTSTGVPSCNGTTCSYTCDSNRQDCNSATAPDTDGCECTGTACCGTGCQTVHSSGLTSPASYYDCDPTGDTTQAEALAACTGTGGTGCSAKTTSCGGILGFGGTSTSAACGTVGSTCYCWVYSGQNSGKAMTGGSGCNISCNGSGSTWN